MVTFLAKRFIPNYEQVTDAKVRGNYGTLCSIVGIFFNVLLFIGKYVAGTLSGSIAIVADSLNSLSDAGSSVITLIGFKFAGRQPDADHPFGHGRVEYLSGLAVSVLILLMGVELGRNSIEKILHPEPIASSMLILGILLVSVLVKCYMAFYNRSIGTKINSAAMRATSTDSLSDAASTFVVFLCTIASQYTSFPIDGWAGTLVAALVVYAGIGAMKETLGPLLGQAPEKEFVDRIHDIVMNHENIIGLHDLVVHDYGPGRVMISLHAEVPGDGDIYELHDMIDIVETQLRIELGCEATIHMDPIAINDELTMSLKKMVERIVVGIDDQLSIHDFRIVTGPTHTNLVFDVVTPPGYGMKDKELIQLIQKKIWEENQTYFISVKIDRAYVQR